MKRFSFYHACVTNILINLFSLHYIDIFYDNYTYMAYTMHHPIYVTLWTISTVYGLFYFSKIIWDSYRISYSNVLHSLNCIGMIFASLIPYGSNHSSWLSNAHVWLLTGMIMYFILHWIFLFTYRLYLKEIVGFIGILIVCFISIGWIGHVAAITEIIFSIGYNLYLYVWTKKIQYRDTVL